jgi:hypothetical protein
VTGKKGRRGGGEGDDGNLRLAGVGGGSGGGATHAGLRGAGGHSVVGCSLLSSDVGVVGSSAGGRDSASAGAVDGEAERASSPVLIRGSAGRTSPAADAVELMGWPRPGQEGDALSAREEEGETKERRKSVRRSRQSRHRCYK